MSRNTQYMHIMQPEGRGHHSISYTQHITDPLTGKATFKLVNKHFVAKSFQKELIVNDSQTHVLARCFMQAEIRKIAL